MNRDHNEEIVLESFENSEQLIPPFGRDRDIQRVLSCHWSRKKTRMRYRLLNDYVIEIVQEYTKKHEAGKKRILAFHVGFLKPKSAWVVSANAFWCYAAIIASIALVYKYRFFVNTDWMIAIAGVIALFLLLFIRSFRVQQRFVSRIAKAPLITIPLRNLSSEDRKIFTEALKKAIDNYPLPYNINPLDEELKLIRTAQESGIIKEKAYKKYRDLILKKYNR